jgi:hypothetical protein
LPTIIGCLAFFASAISNSVSALLAWALHTSSALPVVMVEDVRDCCGQEYRVAQKSLPMRESKADPIVALPGNCACGACYCGQYPAADIVGRRE